MSRKQYYDWEKMFKGVSNHRRLEMLILLGKKTGLSTDEIIENLKINYSTGATHLQKLVRSELVIAYRKGQAVGHKVSERGKEIIRLLLKQ